MSTEATEAHFLTKKAWFNLKKILVHFKKKWTSVFESIEFFPHLSCLFSFWQSCFLLSKETPIAWFPMMFISHVTLYLTAWSIYEAYHSIYILSLENFSYFMVVDFWQISKGNVRVRLYRFSMSQRDQRSRPQVARDILTLFCWFNWHLILKVY